ncbi:putative E3 ubiquitin-protein ligase XBAT34 [Cucurbita pepo subsp. pepo]|uniref:putative E3 ubiquitin-protein ligase XBAT34 n=1 Tax=Cucurbita pepo subsp. pepo TaxID=3664 RepID=UPI000C9D901A|nr:putative E3 ubiquitin-protein ligase XBAT34 [Cucurbita pepo subsp. pepo]XP_023549006.1 putative E3 ubiquitin-protein ligase XBAT34 [Cucurbita pepo subsp. pepo]
MGQQPSKDELVYQRASNGDVDGIKALSNDGAGLEWVDREGRTPLIVACTKPEPYNVAKTLLELGANVNAFGPGRHGGTPLHHAAKRGLENTVRLLLSYRANTSIINDACQTPLEVARAAGHKNVVRAIENHICLFSGWMREFYGPEFLEVLVPHLLSRKVWVVILPCGSRNPMKPTKLELALYTSLEDAQPRLIIPLWKSCLEEHKLQDPDPSVVIVDNAPNLVSRGVRRRKRSCHTSWEARSRFRKSKRPGRLRLAPDNEYDRQQLQWFCDACKGIPQPKMMQSTIWHNHQSPINIATVPPGSEDPELTMAINASIQSAMQESGQLHNPHSSSSEAGASSSSALPPPAPPRPGSSKSAMHEEASHGYNPSHCAQAPMNTGIQITHPPNAVPTAPPVEAKTFEASTSTVGDYPLVDSDPTDSMASSSVGDDGKQGSGNTTCVICLDAPVEGACVPCGHMAGCMSCLSEIKAKNWGCPVCRTKINQVIKLYAV